MPEYKVHERKQNENLDKVRLAMDENWFKDDTFKSDTLFQTESEGERDKKKKRKSGREVEREREEKGTKNEVRKVRSESICAIESRS